MKQKKIKIERMVTVHIEEATNLFIQGYKDLRQNFPTMPKEFESEKAVSKKLTKILESNPGYVSLDNNKVLGYITGYTNIKHLKGSKKGVYSPEWSHMSQYENRDLIYENLYKAIAEDWVKEKNYNHIITYYANNNIRKTLTYLGFGMEVIDAVRGLDSYILDNQDDFTFINANENHINVLKNMDIEIYKHLKKSPTFLNNSVSVKSGPEIKKEFLSDNYLTYLGLVKKKLVSCIRIKKNDGNIDTLKSKDNFMINFAFTLPEYRGSTISYSLLNHTIKCAAKLGAKQISVDFESHNLEGRKFWLKQFSPITYSMVRKVDDRIDI